MESESVKASLYTAENALFPLIAGIGIVANSFVIVVILIWEKSRTNKTVANLFVVNLAIADLFFLLVLPLYMPKLIDRGWVYGGFMCKFAEVIKYINFRASIFFLTTMTVDRYLAIVYSLQSRGYRTRNKAFKICIFLWTLCLLLSIPVICFTNVHEIGPTAICQTRFPGFESQFANIDDLSQILNITADYGLDYEGIFGIEGSSYSYNNVPGGFSPSLSDPPTSNNTVNEGEFEQFVCMDVEHARSGSFAAWVYANFVFFFLIPILVIFFCYVSIIRVTQTRDIRSTTTNDVHHKVAVTVATLVSVFVICWLPFQVYELLILPPGIKVGHVNDCMILKSVFSMLAWSNSAINPILYSISSNKFREKAVAAWTYIRHGEQRVLILKSQHTTQTRLHTSGTSFKSLSVKSPSAHDEAQSQTLV